MPRATLTTNQFLDHRLWDTLPADRPIALQQHWAYGETLKAIGADVSQTIFEIEGKAVAFALLGHRSFYRALDVTSLMRGPLWVTPPTEAQQQTVFRSLKKAFNPWKWKFLAFQPDLPDTPTAQKTLKAESFRQIMTGHSTVWIDLSADEEALRANLQGKWRNQLVKAEKANLTISFGGRKAHQYSWLLEQEKAQQETRGYSAIPTGFVSLYADIAQRFAPANQTLGVLSVSCLQERAKVAGAIFLLHGNSATYHLGWSGDAGRAVNAQNKVLWSGMLALKERGIRFLDLGGINTVDGAGIARFKLGLGASPTTYAGTWV
ncbi:MAG: GNAT family N-acetyltransferase [Alphaproteobacteria bacterium]|nr:GNAT family N-acetyltransferase [Alphaproteobacteria bacterium]